MESLPSVKGKMTKAGSEIFSEMILIFCLSLITFLDGQSYDHQLAKRDLSVQRAGSTGYLLPSEKTKLFFKSATYSPSFHLGLNSTFRSLSKTCSFIGAPLSSFIRFVSVCETTENY